MAMKTLHANISLILLAAAVVVQSKSQVTPQVIYQKLEEALIADSGVLYLMQHRRSSHLKVCLETWFILTYVW